MELIKITDHNGDQAVSARELHSFLEVTERFSNWCERMFQYGFVEGIDYTPLTFLHPQNKQELGDYTLTLDTAKEISMLQRTEKGKQARQYFIQCEKAVQMIRARSLTTKELAQMVIDAENAREEAEKKLAIQQPKVDYVKAVLQSNSFRTVNEIATDLGMTANKLNATLHAHQIQYKQGGVWMLYVKYRSCGYAFSRTDLKNGHTYTQLVWTEKGRAFIHATLNPVMIQSIQTKNNSVNLLQN